MAYVLAADRAAFPEVPLVPGKPLTVGRKNCAINLAHGKVSGTHFTILLESVDPLRVTLTDHSRNSVFVDGKKVGADAESGEKRVRLKAGSTICVNWESREKVTDKMGDDVPCFQLRGGQSVASDGDASEGSSVELELPPTTAASAGSDARTSRPPTTVDLTSPGSAASHHAVARGDSEAMPLDLTADSARAEPFERFRHPPPPRGRSSRPAAGYGAPPAASSNGAGSSGWNARPRDQPRPPPRRAARGKAVRGKAPARRKRFEEAAVVPSAQGLSGGATACWFGV